MVDSPRLTEDHAAFEAQLQRLRSRWPWPDTPPGVEPAEWPLDGGGRELITECIAPDAPFLILEIGSFLGSSAQKWLNASPGAFVIAVDPWEGKWWADYAMKHGRVSLAEQFALKDGPFLTFLASNWKFKDRLFPCRATSPDILHVLAGMGVQPDLVYFDSDKSGADIETAHRLFPGALLTGDDWTWRHEHEYPIRKAVREFARAHDFSVVAYKATWVLKKDRLSLKDHWRNLNSLLRDLVRAARGRLA